MSVLKSFYVNLKVFNQALWRWVLHGCYLVFQIIPVVIAVMAVAFTVTAGFVLILVVTHVYELAPLVGIGTTIAILIGSFGLFVSTIGVLIAALRYATERNSGMIPPEQHRGRHQASTPLTQRQRHWDR
jgi:hypothetical protein